MHILLTVIAVSVFTLGIFFNQVSIRNKFFTEKAEKKVLSEIKTEENVISPTATIAPQKADTNLSATLPSPTSTPVPSSSSLEKYVYPDAQVSQAFNNSISLTTSDDAAIVTKWYRNKIIESGMSVRSFVATSANDKILNKLSGADSESEVTIEIKKDADNRKVFIFITLEL